MSFIKVMILNAIALKPFRNKKKKIYQLRKQQKSFKKKNLQL
jgi:hypothetical protein